MNKALLSYKKEFLEKSQKLETAKETLKKEFVGIDHIIDKVIEYMSSWYIFPQFQERPVVINLWGLTGVGKTSLTNRLMKILEYNDKHYCFDLGEKEGAYSFRDALDSLCANKEDSQVVISLDEFHQSRTKNAIGEEISKDSNRMIWQLIDSGKIQYIDWYSGLWRFEQNAQKLKHLIYSGIEVENGIVVKGEDLFQKEMNYEDNRMLRNVKTKKYKTTKIEFIDRDYYDLILDIAGNKYGLSLILDVEELVLSLDHKASIKLLEDVVKLGQRPTVKKFNKSLIFVLGNLDEAYSMSGNLNADIDADRFYEDSLKITLPKIKESLKSRFRNEQIARLGNNHIVYPAISKNMYDEFIKRELIKRADEVQNEYDIHISFDGTFNKLIYDEGVYPTQGYRPILTTIHQYFRSNLPNLLQEAVKLGLDFEQIILSVNDNDMNCSFVTKEGIEIHKTIIQIEKTLGKIRKSTHDDVQALTAVHESGHAILSCILLKNVPNVVYSRSSSHNSHGFVSIDYGRTYVTKDEIIKRAAMAFGGISAESILFGDDHITDGSNSDIKYATELIAGAIKSEGMGNLPAAHELENLNNNNAFHGDKEIAHEIKSLVIKAKALATEVLRFEEEWLVAMANHLADNSKITKDQIFDFYNKHAKSSVDFIKDHKQFYYRAHLKKKVAHLASPVKDALFGSSPIHLNKSNNNDKPPF